MSAFGPKRTFSPLVIYVCFTPESGHSEGNRYTSAYDTKRTFGWAVIYVRFITPESRYKGMLRSMWVNDPKWAFLEGIGSVNCSPCPAAIPTASRSIGCPQQTLSADGASRRVYPQTEHFRISASVGCGPSVGCSSSSTISTCSFIAGTLITKCCTDITAL